MHVRDMLNLAASKICDSQSAQSDQAKPCKHLQIYSTDKSFNLLLFWSECIEAALEIHNTREYFVNNYK